MSDGALDLAGAAVPSDRAARLRSEVLSRLTVSDVESLGEYDRAVGSFECACCGGSGTLPRHCGRCGSDSCYPEATCPDCVGGRIAWSPSDPSEALASLVEAELLPRRWSDPDAAPRWWCEAHMGRRRGPREAANGPVRWCREVRGSRSRCVGCASPPDVASVASVAMIGVGPIELVTSLVEDQWRGSSLVLSALPGDEFESISSDLRRVVMPYEDGRGDGLTLVTPEWRGPLPGVPDGAAWAGGPRRAVRPEDEERRSEARTMMVSAGFLPILERPAAVVLAVRLMAI